MIAAKQVKIEDQKWDRCSRRGSFRIGDKRALFHTICPLITRATGDWRAYVDGRAIYPHETNHAGMMVFRTFDCDTSLAAMRESLRQTTLGGLQASRSRSDMIATTPMLIDPSTEYTRYAFRRGELIDDPNTPAAIRRIAKNVDAALSKTRNGNPDSSEAGRNHPHNKLWLELSRDDTALSSAVSESLASQQKLRADIALPPVPAAHDETILSVSEKINRVSQAVWPSNSCADYNILTPEFFSSERSVGALLDYMGSHDTTFNVLKFKNNWLEQVVNYPQRLQLKKLLEGINEIKSNDPGRIFMLLEAGYAMYPAAAGGFDIVSTGLRALDRDGRGFARDAAGYGGYFSPKQLIVLPWRHVKKMLEKSGLPCSCEICRKINAVPKRDAWNLQRRLHYILTTSRLLGELTRLVDEQKIEMAMQNLSRSEISNFSHTLPYIHN